LIDKTNSEYNGHLNTGLVGIPVMMEWAAKADEPDFIYSMLKKRSYPGYLYMIDNGANTTWEHWNGERSRIHNCFNGVGQWFYQAVGGIRTIDGEKAYKKFIVDPQIPEGVTWAKTSKLTPYGEIKVYWEIKGDKLVMDILVPVGTTALVYKQGSESVIETELTSGRHSVELDYK
jgi:alpha-L-rhamnosidase